MRLIDIGLPQSKEGELEEVAVIVIIVTRKEWKQSNAVTSAVGIKVKYRTLSVRVND